MWESNDSRHRNQEAEAANLRVIGDSAKMTDDGNLSDSSIKGPLSRATIFVASY